MKFCGCTVGDHLAVVGQACIVLSIFLLPFQVFSQTASEQALTFNRPDSIDDATWQRLRMGYENDKERLLNLLLSLDAKRIDYSTDSLLEVIEKQRAIVQHLNEFQQDTVRQMARADLMLNYVFIRNQTAPRLTGRVIQVGPNKDAESLANAVTQAQSGDCIRLPEGVFDYVGGRNRFPVERGELTDIAIVGAGKDSTTIRMGRISQIGKAVRWRFSDVTIDCGDSEVVYLRSGGSFEFQNCKIFNYNSGAGGSNAIGGSNVIMVVENTEMEGDTGRAKGSGGGDAFDLRGNNLLYCRQVHFVNNGEVIRATFPCVFDRCTATGKDRNNNRLYPYPNGLVLLKDNQIPVREADNVSSFQHVVDSLDFVDLVVGKRKQLDTRSEQIVEKLRLSRHPEYWIGLLRSDNVAVRKNGNQTSRNDLACKGWSNQSD